MLNHRPTGEGKPSGWPFYFKNVRNADKKLTEKARPILCNFSFERQKGDLLQTGQEHLNDKKGMGDKSGAYTEI